MSAEDTRILTDDGFDTLVLHSELPVLVNFWAEGCGGCRQIAPAIDALAREYSGRAVVAKLDVLSNTAAAMRYGIRSIPALLLFKRGRVIEQRIGPIGIVELRRMLDPHL